MAEILLIDDDEKLRPFLRSALAEQGHGVTDLDRADGALETLAHGEFDLVVIDEIMPGLHGSEFISVLRAQGNDIPVILMTGLATGTLIEPMKQLGASVVPKPAAGSAELLKDLLPAVDETLKGKDQLAGLISRTVRLALKLGKTAPNLRWLLDRELRVQVSALVNHDPDLLKEILGESETAARAENAIRLQGAIWHVRFQEESGDYPSKLTQSLAWLAKLLAAPNKAFTVAELKGDPDRALAADAAIGGELETDDVGIRNIKRRLQEIEDIIESTGGSATLEEERAQLEKQLSDAWRGKKMDAPLKAAFRNVSVQMNNLRKKLAAEGMPRLAAHLRAALKIEFPFVGYYPPPGTSAWQI